MAWCLDTEALGTTAGERFHVGVYFSVADLYATGPNAPLAIGSSIVLVLAWDLSTSALVHGGS